jgi:hypothetical protein
MSADAPLPAELLSGVLAPLSRGTRCSARRAGKCLREPASRATTKLAGRVEQLPVPWSAFPSATKLRLAINGACLFPGIPDNSVDVKTVVLALEQLPERVESVVLRGRSQQPGTLPLREDDCQQLAASLAASAPAAAGALRSLAVLHPIEPEGATALASCLTSLTSLHLEVCEAQPLAPGAHPLAMGAQPLAQVAQPLALGAQPLVQGAQLLAQGAQLLAHGAQPLAHGAQPLAQGAQLLVQVAQLLAPGAQPLAPGAQPLDWAPAAGAGSTKRFRLQPSPQLQQLTVLSHAQRSAELELSPDSGPSGASSLTKLVTKGLQIAGLQHLRSLRDLEMQPHLPGSSLGPAAALSKVQGLTQLTRLDMPHAMVDASEWALLAGLPLLASLRLRALSVFQGAAPAARLEELAVQDIYALQEQERGCLARLMPALRRCCIGDSALATRCLYRHPAMQQLVLQGHGNPMGMMPFMHPGWMDNHLSSMPQLQTLVLHQVVVVSPAGLLADVAGCSGLTALQLGLHHPQAHALALPGQLWQQLLARAAFGASIKRLRLRSPGMRLHLSAAEVAQLLLQAMPQLEWAEVEMAVGGEQLDDVLRLRRRAAEVERDERPSLPYSVLGGSGVDGLGRLDWLQQRGPQQLQQGSELRRRADELLAGLVEGPLRAAGLPVARAAAVQQGRPSADRLLMPMVGQRSTDGMGEELAVAVEERGGVQRLVCFAVG